MKRSITKIPLLGKLVLKTGIFITPPFLFQLSCYSPNKINKDNVLLDIKNKGSLLSSDVTIHNIEKHAKVSKPEHINLEFESVTQRNNSIEVEYRIINKDKSKSLPNKVVITGFKDSLINENIIIKPEPIPPINRENPIMKDAETSTLMNQVHQVLQTHLVQNLELKAIRLIHQALQAHLVQILELKAIRLLHQNLKKQIVNLPMNVKLKKQDIG
nr:hypothetical protein [Mycoplasmopsis bovis]